MTKEEMDAYCATCKDRGKIPCNRREACDECGKQEGCLEICVMEHRDRFKFKGGRGYNG